MAHTYLITNTDMYMLLNISHTHTVLTMTALQLLITIITAESSGYKRDLFINDNEGPGEGAFHPSKSTSTVHSQYNNHQSVSGHSNFSIQQLIAENSHGLSFFSF